MIAFAVVQILPGLEPHSHVGQTEHAFQILLRGNHFAHIGRIHPFGKTANGIMLSIVHKNGESHRLFSDHVGIRAHSIQQLGIHNFHFRDGLRPYISVGRIRINILQLGSRLERDAAEGFGFFNDAILPHFILHECGCGLDDVDRRPGLHLKIFLNVIFFLLHLDDIFQIGWP
ncbi:MAG: hypothetical protein UW70_C0051G0003 [Candidatus Peregrinibacteria bacterium GW2011_GWA2_44_7]|nr:MAG: hypothetical protein UW70_C0051G0003 [Candidatus Peregrinibacteria bacterium GW2011_GWA2_44_7]